MKSRSKQLFASFVLAVLAFGVPMLFSRSLFAPRAMIIGFGASAAWVALVASAVVRASKRTPWLFLGLPFAFFWPVFGLVAQVSCLFLNECI